MPDLVVVVPSRGRPEAVADLARACADTCTADTMLLVVVDTDDPTSPRYRPPPGCTVLEHRIDGIYAELNGGYVFYIMWVASDSGHVGAINWGAGRALGGFAPYAIAKLDDDHRPRTRGWDARMLEALRELGSGIVYGNDLLQGARLPTAPAISADIVRALGHMTAPTLRHLYCDDYWRDLGQAADCLRYLPDVVIEHLHPAAGKAEWDDGYRRANDPGQYQRDEAAYREYHKVRFAEDVAKVRALWTSPS